MRTRQAIILGALAYIAILQWAYPLVMVPLFEYSGMTYQELYWTTVAIQYLLACLPALWLPVEMNKPSEYQWWILYVTVIIPSCILPYHVTFLPPREIHVFLAVTIACFWGMCRVSSFRPIRLPRILLSPRTYGCLLGGMTVATYAWLVACHGLPSLFLPFDQVYLMRTELRVESLPAFLSYLLWWQGMAVNPLIAAIGFERRRYLLVLASCLLQVTLYSITSLRTFLCAMVFQVAFGLFILLFRRLRGPLFLYSMVASVIIAVGWNMHDNQAMAPRLLLNRWVYNAGQLSGYYLEFFSSNPKAQMQHSSLPVLRWLFPGPYDLPIGQVIGREYFIEQSDGVYTNATAHIWADAFATFGYGGMVVASILAALMLWVADSICLNINPRMVLMAFCMVGMSLIGQGVQTTVLTGGLIPFILLVVLMPDYQSVYRNKSSIGQEANNA